MLTDKQFNQIAPVDKYGRKVNIQDKHALQNYLMEQKPRLSKEEIKLAKSKEKFYDDNGNFHWQPGSESSDGQISDHDSASI